MTKKKPKRRHQSPRSRKALTHWMLFATKDLRDVTYIFGACPDHLNQKTIYADDGSFRQMLESMGRKENASRYAEAFADECPSVTMTINGHNHFCFKMPDVTLEVASDSLNEWVVVIGGWKDTSAKRAYALLCELLGLHEQEPFAVTFPIGKNKHGPVALKEATAHLRNWEAYSQTLR